MAEEGKGNCSCNLIIVFNFFLAFFPFYASNEETKGGKKNLLEKKEEKKKTKCGNAGLVKERT